MSLFSHDENASAPLADRMRPGDLEEFAGQEHLVGEGKVLRRALESGELPSMILWGPPGSGKTTLASILARRAGLRFASFSAVLSGVKEVREVVKHARAEQAATGARTMLFVDEIHRFNRAQQDAFLPHIEAGTIVLGGATTENPSFALNAALLSRCSVYVLEPLTDEQVLGILRQALADEERGLGGSGVSAEEEALAFLAGRSDGDARRALNALEVAAAAVGDGETITEETAAEALRARVLRYDREGEEHYNLISAFHKAVRGSDPDGALYWLARMLAAGEDPMFLARRMVRIASEDVGNANPSALALAIAARDAYHFLGSPEGELALAQCALYLACSDKSNACYTAMAAATRDVQETRAEEVPHHIRNAPTPLMERLGYGKGYRYDPDEPDGLAAQTYLPESLLGRRYYEPSGRGREADIRARLERWRKLRQEKLGPRGRGGRGGSSGG